VQNGLARTKSIFSAAAPNSSPRTKQLPTPNTSGTQAPKQEENKDSPEYKKKVALATGPLLTMNYENSTAYGMAETLFTCLKDIFEAIIAHESRIGVVSPHKFLEILRRENEMFRTPMHQDAHEFLNLLLNQVVENVEQFSKGIEANKDAKEESDSETSLVKAVAPILNSGLRGPKHNSRWVHELFEGTLTSETRCLTCENISQRDEAFLDLSVDLEQHSSVTSCLRRFSEEEMLCERNKFHCDKCGGLQEAEKRIKIKRLPRILALHLKRFKYTEDMQRLQKLFHRVVYPFYLRLFNTTDDAEDPDRLYELYAVVVHIGGGPYHGHYVSIIKTQDRGWLLFDDEMVEPVDKRFVTKFFGEGQDKAGHPGSLACAYVLFYQETTLEAMQRELESEGTLSVSETQKDPLATNVKLNGAIPNGIHHAHSPSTPVSEETETFAALDHAATTPMPVPSTPLTPFNQPLEATQTSPTIPFLKRRKSNVLAKKEQEKLQKEQDKLQKEQEKLQKEQEKLEKEERKRRKAEEEGLEKQAKQAKKDMEAARKNDYKRQEEELAARYKAAGKASSNGSSSRAGDDENYSSGKPVSGLGIDQDHTFHHPHHHQTLLQPLPPTSHPKEYDSTGVAFGNANGNGNSKDNSGSMLHRFRTTSMSIRQKPKFWAKDKDKEKKGKNSGDHSDLSRDAFAVQTQRSQTPSDTGESSNAGTGSPAMMDSPELGGMSSTVKATHAAAPLPPPPAEKPAKKEKTGKFGLGRKKSVMGLL